MIKLKNKTYVKYKGNTYALLSKIHIKTPTIKKDKIQYQISKKKKNQFKIYR